MNRKRYATSVTAVGEESKLLVFGGRSNSNNRLADEIEEYNITTKIWKILRIKNHEIWEPVEICASIQIDFGTILIFGGSDTNMEDKKSSYLFRTVDNKIEKCTPLPRG